MAKVKDKQGLVFDDYDFDAQLLRSLGHTYDKGADFSECMATAYHIEDGNYNSWHQAWLRSAQRLEKIGNESLSQGHIVSGRRALFRATEYYRQAEYFLRENPQQSLCKQISEKIQACFRLAVNHIFPPASVLSIPYQDQHLSGYFFEAEESMRNNITLIILGGYDSYAEEAFFYGGRAALARGYNVVLFDGPGQGHALRRDGLLMTSQWHDVMTAVIDYLSKQEMPIDPDKIACIGRNFASYLMAQAATKESRLAAIVLDPGQHDMQAILKQQLSPELIQLIDAKEWALFDEKVEEAFNKDAHLRYFFLSRAAAHGLSKASDYFKALEDYRLGDTIQQITCPTAVCSVEQDKLAYRQSKEMFEILNCQKQFILFNDEEGMDIAAPAAFYLKTFEWIVETLKS